MAIDVSTRYLGLYLKNPLVVSSCPLTCNLDSLSQLEEAGAAAVVLPSLFEETIQHEEAEIARKYAYQSDSSAESPSFYAEMLRYNAGPEHYLLHLREAKNASAFPSLPASTAWPRATGRAMHRPCRMPARPP